MENDTQQQPSSPADSYIAAVQSGNAPAVTPQPSTGPIDDSGNSPAPSPALASPQNGQPNAPSSPAAPAPAHENFAHKFVSSFAGEGGTSASRFWRGLVGAAMTGIVGAGAAENAPVIQGPYGPIKSTSIAGAASRGAEAGIALRQNQEDRQRKQQMQDAEEQRKNQQQKIELDDFTLRKAADARQQTASIQNSVEHEKRMTMLDQSINTGNWEQAQRTAKAAQDQVSFFNALQDVGAQPLPDADGKPLQFETHDAAERAAHENPSFFIGNFKTRTAYDPSTGKYGVYKIPDTDIKDVQLKDEQGNVHTIPRMSPTDYLDYQNRQQNLTKGALGIQEAKIRLAQLSDDRKASTGYAKALEALDAAGGDADKLAPSARTLLYSTASKNLGDAIRARVAADKAEDPEAQEAAGEAIKHYSGVLSKLHGRNPDAATQQGGLNPAQYSQALSHAMTLPQDQAIAQIQAAKVFSDADKKRLIADVQKNADRVGFNLEPPL